VHVNVLRPVLAEVPVQSVELVTVSHSRLPYNGSVGSEGGGQIIPSVAVTCRCLVTIGISIALTIFVASRDSLRRLHHFPGST
jgi:hypothetical protein